MNGTAIFRRAACIVGLGLGLASCGAAVGAAAATDGDTATDAQIATDAPDVAAVADVGDVADVSVCKDPKPKGGCCNLDLLVEPTCYAGKWYCNPTLPDGLCPMPTDAFDAGPKDTGPDVQTPPDVPITPDITPDDLATGTDASSDDVPSSGGPVGALCGSPGDGVCATGLVCCYPCGIPGCHNTCATPCTGPGCAGGCMLVP